MIPLTRSPACSTAPILPSSSQPSYEESEGNTTLPTTRILLYDAPDRGPLHTTTNLPYFEVPIKVSLSLSASNCLLAGVASWLTASPSEEPRSRLVLRVGSHTASSSSASGGSSKNLFRASAKGRLASEARSLFDAKDPSRILAVLMMSNTSDLASMQLYLNLR
ncbi:hypothetical protein BDZ85DRAFT_55230 [Elsinoe ampelina]|uniref:Uncharacterized protein n=1 Tax=Elsinoe ampelina TaxID=302913 RepID=A0A6A6GMC7_9PEZI|nr:hypothetical protein BDZ85DRAFT_55230 [Elsinoe ampelina]